jgi:hypothetical protein
MRAKGGRPSAPRDGPQLREDPPIVSRVRPSAPASKSPIGLRRKTIDVSLTGEGKMVEVATLAITWTEALNRRDAERLRDLSAAEIELLGPKGKGKGHELLSHWLGRAGATFQTVKVFARGNAAVLD